MEDPVRALPPLSRDEFARRGFVVLRAPIISRDYCDLLNSRLEKLLRGEYDVPGLSLIHISEPTRPY